MTSTLGTTSPLSTDPPVLSPWETKLSGGDGQHLSVGGEASRGSVGGIGESGAAGNDDVDDLGLTQAELRAMGLGPNDLDGIGGLGGSPGGNRPDDGGSFNDDELASDEDVRLWVQNQRFQAAVMRAMENTVNALQDKLMEKVASLAASEKSREDLAVGLHEMRTELQRVQKSLQRSRRDFDEAVSSRKIALTELGNARREVERLKKELTESQQTITKLRRDHSQALDQLQTVRTLSSVVECNLKVSAQTNANLQNELERAQKQNRQAENVIADLRAQLQAAQDERQRAIAASAEERNNVLRERAIVERLEADLRVVKAANDAITKQWQTALAAMEKRDAVVVKLSEQHASTADQLKTAQAIANAQAKAAEELKEKAEELEQARERERLRAAHLHGQAKTVTEERDALLKDNQLLQAQLDAAHALLESKEKAERGLLENLEHQKRRCAAFQAELESTKTQLQDTTAELNKQVVSAAKAEEKMRSDFERELKEARQSLIAAENDRHFVNVRLVQLEEELKQTKRENEALEVEFKQTSNSYNQIQREVKALEDELERASYRANKHLHESLEAQRRAEAEKAAVATAAEAEIASLKAKLKDKQKQLDEVSSAFLASQHKILAAYNKERNVYESAASLKSQLATAETIRDKLKTNLDRLQTEYEDSVLDSNETKLNLRRTEEKLAAAQERIRDLERRLADAMFLERAKQARHEEEIAGLRAQLARHQSESRDWVALIQTLQREKHQLESRCELYKHRVAGMEKQVAELAQKAHEAKQKQKQTLKENSVAERQFQLWNRNFETILQKELGKRTNLALACKLVPSSSSANLWSYGSANRAQPQPQTPRGSAAAALEEGLEKLANQAKQDNSSTDAQNMIFIKELVSRLRSELQRVSALNAERISEIVRLRQQLNAIALSDEELKDRENAYVGKVKELILQRKQLQAELKRLQRRSLRAETVAASLEYQLRVAIMNRKKAELQGGDAIDGVVAGAGGADSSVLLSENEVTTTQIALAASGKPADAQKLQELSLWDEALKELHTSLLTVPSDVKPSEMLQRFIDGDVDTAAAEAAANATAGINHPASQDEGVVGGANAKSNPTRAPKSQEQQSHQLRPSFPSNVSSFNLLGNADILNSSASGAQLHSSASSVRLTPNERQAQSGAILAVNAVNTSLAAQHHHASTPQLFSVGSAPPTTAKVVKHNQGSLSARGTSLNGSPSLIDLIKSGKAPPGWAPTVGYYSSATPRPMSNSDSVSPNPQAGSPRLATPGQKGTPLSSVGAQVLSQGSRGKQQ